MPFGRSSDTYWMFEHRTEVSGGLSVNPEFFRSVQWSSEDFRERGENTDVEPKIAVLALAPFKTKKAMPP